MPRTPLILFLETDGSVTVLDWLRVIPLKAAAKCRIRLQRLAELGHELRRPEADLLRDGIDELRASHGGVHYRLLYFFHGQAAVVAHGITKESAVPPRKIQTALRRRAEFFQNPARHTATDG